MRETIAQQPPLVARLVKQAKHLDAEDGSTILVDSTAVESAIRHPTDNSLLLDGVRALSRLLRRAQEGVRRDPV